MARIYCHYKLPLFIRKDVRYGISGAKRPCSESILEPIKKRCSIIDTPNIEYPSSKNHQWVHCYPCDHWYCPKHASSANDIQHDNCREAAQRRLEMESIQSKSNKTTNKLREKESSTRRSKSSSSKEGSSKSKSKSSSSKEMSKERTSTPKSKPRSCKSTHKNISSNLVQPIKRKSFIVSKARAISPLYEKEIVENTEYREISDLTLSEESSPSMEQSPPSMEQSPPLIMRTFSTQTDEEISDTETEAVDTLNTLNAVNALYLELQSNYDTLNSKYTVLKTLGPALNSANKRKISELHSENSTLISEKEELSIDIQRLLDQIEKLSGIISENLHNIQDIESQRDALTEWFPNSILRKLILEKITVTAPKLEELSPTRNPLFNH